MLNLIFPVIFPSWRFFSSIGPSPRIKFAFIQHENEEPQEWQLFRPKPARLTLLDSIKNLFFHPQWNETLYINTCAERLFESYSPMREQEIMRRLIADLDSQNVFENTHKHYLVFCITAVIRDQDSITESVVFMSKPVRINGEEK